MRRARYCKRRRGNSMNPQTVTPKTKKPSVKELLLSCQPEPGQLMRMIEERQRGSLKIDRRRYNRATLRWAEHWGLLQRQEDNTLSYGSSYQFDAIRDAPIEILWTLFEKHIMPDEHAGYSLGKRKGWIELNIYPINHPSHSLRDRDDIEHCLLRLAQHNKLYFQACADIWDVRKRKDGK